MNNLAELIAVVRELIEAVKSLEDAIESAHQDWQEREQEPKP